MKEQKFETIDIKGKDYVTINQRVQYFRENYEGWAILTEWIEVNGDMAICQAKIVNPDGVIISTGTAMELKENGFINKFSHIENCETSAVGRALGFMAIGIDTSIASAEEVANAVKNQGRTDYPKQEKGTNKFKPETDMLKAKDRIKTGLEAVAQMKKLDKDEKAILTNKLMKQYLGTDDITMCDDLPKLNALLAELVRRVTGK